MARRALLIATDRYQDPSYEQLRAPVGDVESVRHALADPECGGFEVLTPLVNESEASLRLHLETFFDDAAYEDLLLLYISGHGELRAGRLYFPTTGTRRTQLRATSLADTYIHELIVHSPARSVLLVLDCCHSAAFGKGLAKGAPEVELAERFEGSGRVTLAASAGIEYAWEDDAASPTDRHLTKSVFTAAFVEALHNADANEDGEITLDELFGYVSDEVRRRNPQQTPRLSGERAGQIVVARTTTVRSALSAELVGRMESASYYVRIGAVEELAHLRTRGDRRQGKAATAALEQLANDPDSRVADRATATLVEVMRGLDAVPAAPEGGPNRDVQSRPASSPLQQLVAVMKVRGTLPGLAFDARGERLLVERDGVLHAYSVPDATQLAGIGGSNWKERLAYGALSHWGDRIVASNVVREYVGVWAVPGGQELRRLDFRPNAAARLSRSIAGGNFRTPRVAAVAQDGRLALLTSYLEGWEVRDLDSGDVVLRKKTNWRNRVTAGAFAPSGKSVFVAATDDTISEFRVSDGQQVLHFKLDLPTGHLQSLEMASDGELFGGYENGEDDQVAAYHVIGRDGRQVFFLELERVLAAHGSVSDPDADGDGEEDDEAVEDEQRAGYDDPTFVWSFGLASGGRTVLAVNGDDAASLWSVETRELLGRWQLRRRSRTRSDRPAPTFALSPDGRYFATADYGTVSVWPTPV